MPTATVYNSFVHFHINHHTSLLKINAAKFVAVLLYLYSHVKPGIKWTFQSTSLKFFNIPISKQTPSKSLLDYQNQINLLKICCGRLSLLKCKKSLHKSIMVLVYSVVKSFWIGVQICQNVRKVWRLAEPLVLVFGL